MANGGSVLATQLPEVRTAQEIGFGLYEGYFKRASETLLGSDPLDAGGQPSGDDADPNLEYIERLSGAELTAYGEARYGLEGCEPAAHEASGFGRFDEVSGKGNCRAMR